MRAFIHKINGEIRRITASKWFLIGTVVLFVVHASWVALSSNLLPYDEYYHVGIIREYAAQWSPIITRQSSNAAYYGDVTRLPSYLYHYGMSFPYRLFSLFTSSQSSLVIMLRFLNIAMVIGGVLLFKKLFDKAGISRSITHVATAFFLLTPIVVIVAAENNYDNLIFLLTPVFLLLAFKMLTTVPKLPDLLWFIALGCLATLVKDTFLVLFATVGLFVLVHTVWRYRSETCRVFTNHVRYRSWGFIVAAVICVFAMGLFFERYATNFIQYKQVHVTCEKVQPVTVCERYTVWRRNNNALQARDGVYQFNSFWVFNKYWITKINTGFYAIYANIIPDNLDQPDPFGHYEFRPLIKLPILIEKILIITGMLLVMILFKKLWQANVLNRLTLLVLLATVLSLWLFNYTSYLKYERAYAIQSRYMMPILLPVIVLFAQAFVRATKNSKTQYLRPIIMGLIAVYIISGGALGWIIRSEDNWYWHSNVVKAVNHRAQSVLKRVIPN